MLGMTQEQLGKKIGHGPNMVARTELGQRRLDVTEYLSIVVALGLDPVDFWVRSMVKPNIPSSGPRASSEDLDG
jgi:transcriptional regulator with XRE-family HTH domain